MTSCRKHHKLALMSIIWCCSAPNITCLLQSFSISLLFQHCWFEFSPKFCWANFLILLRLQVRCRLMSTWVLCFGLYKDIRFWLHVISQFPKTNLNRLISSANSVDMTNWRQHSKLSSLALFKILFWLCSHAVPERIYRAYLIAAKRVGELRF